MFMLYFIYKIQPSPNISKNALQYAAAVSQESYRALGAYKGAANCFGAVFYEADLRTKAEVLTWSSKARLLSGVFSFYRCF